MTPKFHASRLLLAFTALLPAALLPAATYLPAPDAELARRALVIVRATVVSTEARLERVGSVMRPFTIATLQRLENLKGSAGETLAVRLPGGRVGGVAWWVPGTPVLKPGSEVVLMLDRDPGHPGLYRLAEFGLSKFDLITDSAGRRFAVRPAFGWRSDLVLTGRSEPAESLTGKSSVLARDAESFLAALRAAGRGEPIPDVTWSSPASDGTSRGDGIRQKWVNIAGREPGDCGEPCLFRWFWDTGRSSAGVVTTTGTQSNLRNDDPNCGMDSICDVQNAVDQWSGVSQTDVRYSGVAASGNVVVHLDALQSHDGGSAWNTALDCGGGVIGLGGPGDGFGPFTYRGDSPYYAPSSGEVSMRKVTCSNGYPARIFRTAVLHELGHTLGLGHPDDDGSGLAVESLHSTTSPSDWASAVMNSTIPLSRPDAPQADDVQAIQYYYGTAPAGAAPVASFAFTPTAPAAGSPVSFQDSSTGSPTGWNWDFGDTASGASNTSSQQNPAHAFSAPGTYTVTLSAGSLSGTGTATKQVVVAGGSTGSCTPDATTLCLNGARFRVTASWQKQDGTTGAGTAVPLTGDSGYFWFFNSANVEVVTKVLNGCFDPFNSYWVFAAGLTNVKVTLSVTDTSTGALKTYVNPLGTAFLPIQDTSAFSTCP
jgi:PKD repeat protein